MIGCLVLSHGKIAEAVVDASRKIAGECDQLFTLQQDHLTPKGLYQAIAQLIEAKQLDDGLFVLVALRGGSYWHAAARVARDHSNVVVISGYNLSTVLSFVTKREQFSFQELSDILVADAVRGITKLTNHKPGVS